MRPRWPQALLAGIFLLAGGGPICAQETVITNGAAWRWRRGTNEVSTPTTAWRTNGFNDAAWHLGNAPFHYGNSGTTGDDGITAGTILLDMRNNYRGVFLRRTFVITNVAEVQWVTFSANYDDGYVAWINGTEIARTNFNGSPAYTSTATTSIEPSGNHAVSLTATQASLVVGTNVLAVQAFNSSPSGSDFRINASLQITKLDPFPPVVTNVTPAPGSTLAGLTQATVSFSEPMYGVEAQDLELNEVPATGLIGGAGTNRFTFTFVPPPAGLAAFTWADGANLVDAGGTPFNPAGTNATWSYTVLDNTAPIVRDLTPVAGATVAQLTRVEIQFSEPVQGVTAGDLTINGQPAASVNGAEAGPYVFTFPQPAPGAVNFAWAGGHGISDLAGNPFAGSGWSLTLNPALQPGDVIINEFVAGNTAGLLDEDGEPQDWIELYNRGTNAVNLLGWSLSDNPNAPGLWTFPTQVLNPGQYLVVFASGKDRRAPVGSNKYHTNFKLDLFGEYLALYNAESPRVPVSAFAPKFPEQRNNYSYGRDPTNALRYFQTPTPGVANGSSFLVGLAVEPHFSVPRGLFSTPFNLLLTTAQPGAIIRYTLNGSEPTLVNGLTYTAPLTLTKTTIVRAATFASGFLPSRSRTHSYFYLDDVLTQPNNPPNQPATWGTRTGVGFTNDLIPADYEMDLDPVRVTPTNANSAIDPVKLQRLKDGLRELPVVSLAMDNADLFAPTGIYSYPNVNNKDFPEKPCSLEMILPDGSTAFATTAGIKAHGNASRAPEKNPKHGFGLKFSGDFGPTALEYQLFPDSPATKHDDLVLRADFGVSWRHWSDSPNGAGSYQRSRASRFRDAWMKHAQRDLGGVAGHTRYCHLFMNGLYWGTYDFSEQSLGQFAENYLAASTNGYDIYEQGIMKTSAGGNATAYTAMLAVSGLNNNANYELMKQYLDMPGFIDYTLLCFWAGAQDWGVNKNWYAVRPRLAGPQGVFKYMVWDGENYLVDEGVNRVANTDVPSNLHTKLDDNPQYRLDFADRVHKHMIAPGGALTREAVTARWNYWVALLDKSMVAESCRWGDYRRDVHPYQDGIYALYTREDHWLPETTRMTNLYFANRPAAMLSQLRAGGLYPALDAPEFRQTSTAGPIIGGGSIDAGYVVAMKNPGGAGTIYYTTDGSDPRVYYASTVAVTATNYTAPITLNASRTLKARILNGSTWSALNEASFSVAQLGSPLRFTEIMYNPVGGDAYEFVEIQNVGALPANLSGFSLDGLNYIFPENTVLPAGAILLLGSSANPGAFAVRYPSAVVAGYFGGNLSNGGERLALLDQTGQTVVAVHYDDENGWPTSPDGGGFSLEIIDPHGDPNAPANWRASSAVNGTPGTAPGAPAASDIVLNEVMADNAGSVTNGGAFPDWIELHNRGTGTVSLANWSLTDDSNARKFIIPAGTNLPAGGFLVIWCDTTTNAPGLHTGFALGRQGETVSLFDANTNRVDALTFGLQLTDYTAGRIGDDWELTLPTPGATNVAAPLASPTNITINEWLASPTAGGLDWLELFNRSATAPVSLRGMYLGTSNATFRLGALSFLAPLGHLQLFAEESAGADQLEFKLPAGSGAIVLYRKTGAELERVTYGAQTAGVSEGRLPDGAATIAPFAGSASPGASNYVLTYSGPLLNEVLARNDRAATTPWGSSADFVELFNPGGSDANLTGMALGDSANFGKAWKFPVGTSIPAGGYLLVWCDSAHAASTSASGPLNSGFALSGDCGDVVLFNAAGQPVDSVSHGLQVQDLSLGRNGGNWQLLATPTPGAANSAVASLGSVTGLRFNEWMAAPLSGDDWFELYNPGTQPVDLGGLFLTDNPSESGLTNSPIAPLSFIGAGRWVRLSADGNRSAGRDHANFSLDSLGETLRLYNTNLALIDAVDFGVQAAGVSQGRLPDGTTNFVSFPTTPTPAAANFLPLTNVIINEILTHTDPPLEDAVELFNPTASDVNISGWYLSDSQSDLKRYRVPDGTVVPAGGFRVFYQNQFGPADGETDSPPLFTFNSAHGEAVYLSQADGGSNFTGFRAIATFDAAANGVSFGRFPTSLGTEFVALSQRSFGADNPTNLAHFRTGLGASNAYPLVGPLVINEIMYHPPDYGTNTPDNEEFIELLNLTGSPTPLYDPAHASNVWRLANAVAFDFPPNTSIPAHGTLVVVPFDPVTDAAALATFRARYGTNVTLVGPYSGKLDNAGESVELWRPDTPQAPPHSDAGYVPQLLVERVIYSDALPWPTNADGSGLSLQRITAADYGNDPVNWQAAAPSASPVATNNPPAITLHPQSRTVFVGENVLFAVAASGAAPLAYQWLSNNVPLAGQTATNLALAFVPSAFAASYRAQVTNAAGSTLSDPAVLTVLSPPTGGAALVSASSVRLAFPVISNRSYQVQFKTNLSDAAWQPLGAPVFAAGNALAVEDNLTNQPQRFYRLMVLP